MQWFHRGDRAWDGTRTIAMNRDEVRAAEVAAAAAARLSTPAGAPTFAPPPQRGWTQL